MAIGVRRSMMNLMDAVQTRLYRASVNESLAIIATAIPGSVHEFIANWSSNELLLLDITLCGFP
jgi:hypothetical protein